jgi:hypothetical protein
MRLEKRKADNLLILDLIDCKSWLVVNALQYDVDSILK